MKNLLIKSYILFNLCHSFLKTIHPPQIILLKTLINVVSTIVLLMWRYRCTVYSCSSHKSQYVRFKENLSNKGHMTTSCYISDSFDKWRKSTSGWDSMFDTSGSNPTFVSLTAALTLVFHVWRTNTAAWRWQGWSKFVDLLSVVTFMSRTQSIYFVPPCLKINRGLFPNMLRQRQMRWDPHC